MQWEYTRLVVLKGLGTLQLRSSDELQTGANGAAIACNGSVPMEMTTDVLR